MPFNTCFLFCECEVCAGGKYRRNPPTQGGCPITQEMQTKVLEYSRQLAVAGATVSECNNEAYEIVKQMLQDSGDISDTQRFKHRKIIKFGILRFWF